MHTRRRRVGRPEGPSLPPDVIEHIARLLSEPLMTKREIAALTGASYNQVRTVQRNLRIDTRHAQRENLYAIIEDLRARVAELEERFLAAG